MRDIAPDEKRSNGTDPARPYGVPLQSPLKGVATLARGNQPALCVAPTQRALQCNHGASQW